MNHKPSYIACCLLLAGLLAGCSQDDMTYSGEDHILWADSVRTLPVVDNDSVFTITLSAMRTADHDRNVAVELVADSSNAIRGRHFDILNYTATIPAGKLTADICVRGYGDRLAVGDSLGFYLRIIGDRTTPLYGATTRVMLQKAKRFDINDFCGYAVMQSSWIYTYMNDVSERLVTVVADPSTPNRLVIRSFMYDGYDVRVDLTTDNLLTPDLHFDTQVFGPTADAFGTIYGNGKIMMAEPANYTSYYSSVERFLYLFTTLYVDNVGTVGTFAHVLKFITDEEAAAYYKK